MTCKQWKGTVVRNGTLASFGALAAAALAGAAVAQIPPAVSGGGPATPSAAATPPVPATPLPTGSFSTGEVEAQVTEATRKGGILTVKVRFAVAEGASFPTNTWLYSNPDAGYKEAYVVAGDKKYFVLKDAEGAPLMPPGLMLNGRKDRGAVGIWWGKFPAPPAEVRDFSLALPQTSPLDEIPIRDS